MKNLLYLIWLDMRGLFLAMLLVTLIIILCAGCASTAFHYEDTNGNKLDGHSWRLLWQTEHVFIGIQTNGLRSIELNKTQPDSGAITATGDALGSLVGAAIKAGIAAGAIP